MYHYYSMQCRPSFTGMTVETQTCFAEMAAQPPTNFAGMAFQTPTNFPYHESCVSHDITNYSAVIGHSLSWHHIYENIHKIQLLCMGFYAPALQNNAWSEQLQITLYGLQSAEVTLPVISLVLWWKTACSAGKHRNPGWCHPNLKDCVILIPYGFPNLYNIPDLQNSMMDQT